jgi:hypothetical protein
MAFDWLKKFQHEVEKEPNYAAKTLAAYRMGIRAKGAIRGVTIDPAPSCCNSASRLPRGTVYHPDEAPILPLTDCPEPEKCGCVYRPAMDYEPPSPGSDQ